jgi:hypothetical protein
MTDRQDRWQQPRNPQQGYGQQNTQEPSWQPQEYDPALHAQRIGGGRQQEPWQHYPPQQPPAGYQPHDQSPQVPPWQGQPPVPPHQPPRRAPSWPARHKVLSGLIAVAAIVIIAAAASSSNNPSKPTASTTNAANRTAAASSTTAAGSPASPTAAVSASGPNSPAAPVSPPMTASQQQAVDAAQSYLSEGQGFSRQGLLQQLTSNNGNGFSNTDAEFAISDLNPDWDQQAVDAAQSYLSEGQGFSQQGLLQQLTSSSGAGFTEAQAEHAINSLHPDWDAQAVDAAKGYMQMSGFSRSSLIEQLTSSYGAGFTEAQADYAVSRVGL